MNSNPSPSPPQLAQPAAGDLPFALGLAAASAFAFIAGSDIEGPSLANNQDPGPRFLPWIMAGLLAFGALHELARWILHRRTQTAPATPPATGESLTSAAGPWLKHTTGLLGMLVAYAVLSPWIGFFPATLLFAMGAMRLLGVGWIGAALSSVLLLVAIRLLFVSLFKVQLPPGLPGLPWT